MTDENMILKWAEEQKKRSEASKAALTQLLSTRPEVALLTVQYDGSSDQGQISEVTALDENNEPIPLHDEFRDAVEKFVYDLLEMQCPGWELGAGSEGLITINARTLQGSIEYRYLVEESHEIGF
jgi:hypothetical protein